MGIERLCKLFGKTRHAFYDHNWRSKDDALKDDLILSLVHEYREQLPRIGTRKLHYLINQKLGTDGLTVGRDHLFNLLADYKLLIRSRKRIVITTNSRHWMKKYSNLIKDLTVHRPEQVWVSDITYLSSASGFMFLSLITDAYTHKIVGFNLSKDLKSQGVLNALIMALTSRNHPGSALIHHSDRGSQYCCKEYVEVLRENNIAISMTENGDPYQNAVAERVNGILKHEFNLYSNKVGYDQTRTLVEKHIAVYNGVRPHSSCDFYTPEQMQHKQGAVKKRWKTYRKTNFPNLNPNPIKQ